MSDAEKPAPLAYRTSDMQHAPTRPTTNQSLGIALLTVVLLVGGGFLLLMTLLVGPCSGDVRGFGSARLICVLEEATLATEVQRCGLA